MRSCIQSPLWWASLLASTRIAAAQTNDPDLGTVLANQTYNISTYYGLLQQYPKILFQLPTYGGITIIAPSNSAFLKLPSFDPSNSTQIEALLTYHILTSTFSTTTLREGPTSYATTLLTSPLYTNVTTGQTLLVAKQSGDEVIFTSGYGSRSSLVVGDIPFKGGLVQVIDTLLVPPLRLEPTMRDYYLDLVSFLSALYFADLVPDLASSPDVTIFAPRNAAFQLLSGTLAGLSKDKLAGVLKYHIVPGRVLLGGELANNTNLTSSALDAAGRPVDLHLLRAGNNLYVDSAQIIQPDILVANGVVHMIGSVLNPDAPLARPDPALGTQAPVFGLTGATATGSRVATPFITALPCTVSCPVPTTSGTGNGTEVVSSTTERVRTTSSKGNGGGGARCTGLGVAGLGLLGVGLGVVGVA